MDLGLAGRSVVVTGASRGIGRACAEAFAAEGARLHLVARGRDALQLAQDEIARDHGVPVSIQAVDMAASGAATAVFAACPDADILVNNAGGIRRGNLMQLGEAEWRQGWELKVFGYINMTREYYRRMQERRSGVIVNVIGLAAEKHEYDYVAGSSGNAALAAFTRTLGSASLDYGVRVVGVNPGWVETDRGLPLMRSHAANLFGDPERWRDVIGTWGIKRQIAPHEIADVVAFLASGRAGAICGEVVNIDLGFSSRNYPRSAE
jgi:3-oxoacyl-[acyl-carrier protein] reductase